MNFEEGDYVDCTVIDVCARTFLIVGDNGKEKTVTCETTQQFMDVLEVVTDLLEPERIEYADLAIHGKKRR
jgi:hypothetical protein|tara:strand:+ start:141 stop:353 length:213 start_codon:yes stop_codon:yes gene_type:complete